MTPLTWAGGSARFPLLAATDERLDTTSMCLVVGYGARHDPEAGGGLAHLLEHVLLSTPHDGGYSFCEYVDRLGGHANAETGLELMIYYARVHADDTERVAEALCRSVLRPSFDADVFATERDVVLQELAAAEADPSDVVQDAILAALYPRHPLGRPVGGTKAEIEALTAEMVAACHREAFLASPAALITVGPRVPAIDLAASASDLSSAAAAAEKLEVSGPTPSAPRWPREFSWVCLGAPSPARGEPDRATYALLATLLGSNASSLLYRRLRNDNGLAYAFQAWDVGYTEMGAWRLLVGVNSGRGDEIVRQVHDCLDGLASTGPESEDLAAAVRQAEMRLIFDIESPLEYARLVALRTYAGTVPWSAADELTDLRAVRTGDVQRAAESVRDNLVCVVRPEGAG